MTPEISLDAFKIFVTGLDHAESFAFDRRGDLCCVTEAGLVLRISPERKISPMGNLGSVCTGMAFSPVDQSLFACVPGQGVARLEANGEQSLFATQAGAHKTVRPAGGVFDSKGNFYLADSGFWDKNNGYVLRFRPDGTGEVLAGPFGFLPALALSADEKFLIAIESDKERVLRFALRADESLEAPEVFAEKCGRFASGLTIDAAGNVYVSGIASDDIWRIDSARQKTLLAVDMWSIQLAGPTCLGFGGANFDELYVINQVRSSIVRVNLSCHGQLLAHQKSKVVLKNRPMAL